MATSKTLKPTNVTISIPAMSDRPNQSVNSNCIDKLADAVNNLQDNTTKRNNTGWGTTITAKVQGALALILINNYVLVQLWIPSTNDISVLVMAEGTTFKKTGANGSVTFGQTSEGTNYTITRDGENVTITATGTASIKIIT